MAQGHPERLFKWVFDELSKETKKLLRDAGKTASKIGKNAEAEANRFGKHVKKVF